MCWYWPAHLACGVCDSFQQRSSVWARDNHEELGSRLLHCIPTWCTKCCWVYTQYALRCWGNTWGENRPFSRWWEQQGSSVVDMDVVNSSELASSLGIAFSPQDILQDTIIYLWCIPLDHVLFFTNLSASCSDVQFDVISSEWSQLQLSHNTHQLSIIPLITSHPHINPLARPVHPPRSRLALLSEPFTLPASHTHHVYQVLFSQMRPTHPPPSPCLQVHSPPLPPELQGNTNTSDHLPLMLVLLYLTCKRIC